MKASAMCLGTLCDDCFSFAMVALGNFGMFVISLILVIDTRFEKGPMADIIW